MELFGWRPWAKSVAIIDIVFIFLSVIMASFLITIRGCALIQSESNPGISSFNSELSSNDVTESEKVDPSSVYRILLLVVVASALVAGLQLWAAIKLLMASTIGADPKKAISLAGFWRNVTLIFLIISIAGNIRRPNALALIIAGTWRGVSLYIVHSFIQEIEDFLESPSRVRYTQPENVIVIK